MREDMVFVKGGKYKLFENNNIEVETFDLEVSKYLVTQKLWTDVMGRNPSLVEDILGMKPVENITWWHTLQFCNKLSELEGLKPVYDLSQIKSAKLYINQLDDEKSINYYEDFLINKNGKIGDFSKTEGYRLPTSIEWEWFAGGGQKAINKGTFGHIFHKSDNMLLVWGHIKGHIAAKFFSRCFASFLLDLSAKRQPQRIKRCGCRPNSFAFRFFLIPMFCQFLTGFGGHFTVSAACLCSSCTKVCSSGRRVPLSG